MCRIHDERVHSAHARALSEHTPIRCDGQKPNAIHIHKTYSYAFSVRWTFGFLYLFFSSGLGRRIRASSVYTFGHKFYDFFIISVFVFVFGCQSQFNSISFVNIAVRSIKVMIIDNYNTQYK